MLLTVTPGTAHPGDTVTITGVGFASMATGHVAISPTGDTVPFTASASGGFTVTYVVPATAVDGEVLTYDAQVDPAPDATTTNTVVISPPPPPPPPGPMDMIVVAAGFDVPNATAGQLVHAWATFQNIGGTASPAGTINGIKFVLNGVFVAWSDTNKDSVPPGGTVTVTSNSGPGAAAGTGTFPAASGTLTAQIDDVNRYGALEPNKANNTLSVPVTVALPPSPFPLSVSPNKRGIVDVSGKPYFILGEPVWFLQHWTSTADIDTWLTDRANRGLNHVAASITMYDNWKTADGISLFLKADGVTPATGWADSDFGHPNPAYFTGRVQHLLDKALALGIGVNLGTVDVASYATISPWLTRLAAQGTGVAQAYGAWLANRFPAAQYPNVIWAISGNDYCPDGVQVNHKGSNWNPLVNAIATGIRSVDTTRLLYAGDIIGRPLDVASWTWQQLSPLYTYVPPEFYARSEYARAAWAPVLGLEFSYLGEDNAQCGVACTAQFIGRQFWWSVLAGGYGGMFTGGPTALDKVAAGWQNGLAGAHLPRLVASAKFLRGLAFQKLAPDLTHAVMLNSNLGTEHASIDTPVGISPNPAGNLLNNHYRVCSYASDGSLALVFIPDRANPNAPITIDLTKFGGQVVATWVDPVTAAPTAAGSFANTGTKTFQPLVNNSAGTGEWVLKLESPPFP